MLLAWTVGALVRTSLRARRTQRERERAERERIEEQERGRIARDMHDVVGHSLAVIIAQADGARYAADADPQAGKDALATISTTARSALADVRLLLAQLRHSEGMAPQPMLNDLESLYSQVRAAGLAVRRVRPALSVYACVTCWPRSARGLRCNSAHHTSHACLAERLAHPV